MDLGLDDIIVHYRDGGRWIDCFCTKTIPRSIVPHLKRDHPDKWTEWTRQFIWLRGAGFPLKRIMRAFSDGKGSLLFSWTVVERAIRDAVESDLAVYSPPRKKTVPEWAPKNFRLETTTSWDFLNRGNWAVHTGDYRGNWPPQLVRNLIKRYSQEGDLIIDPFMGGGTTLLEAWLLQRRSLGLDISKLAVQTTTGRLEEMESAAQSSSEVVLNSEMKPVAMRGNALEFRKIMDCLGAEYENITLACIHPPYLNALQYTKDDENDLSRIADPREFARRIGLLAQEVHSALKPDGLCAVLMGDVRRDGRLIPLGFETLVQFLKTGFELQDSIIKAQHRDRSSEFYLGKDKQLLLSHEYLFILRKPKELGTGNCEGRRASNRLRETENSATDLLQRESRRWVLANEVLH